MVTRSLEGALRGIGELQAHLPVTTSVLVGLAALGGSTAALVIGGGLLV